MREMARASFFLDLVKRKFPLARESESSFLGFRKKASSKLDTHAAGFRVRSDWPDLNDLCNWTGVDLQWSGVDTTHNTPYEIMIKDKNSVPRNSCVSLLSIKHQ